MRLAREAGATVVAVTNVMGSQATRDADAVLYTRAGLEIGVAATKTFVSQVAAMYLIALKLAELKGTLGADERRELIGELRALPHYLEEIDPGRRRARAEEIAEQLLRDAEFFLYLGRHVGLGSRARGRAEAEGGLLHPDRRLRRRRDEARPDRAARRDDAGRLHRDRLAGLDKVASNIAEVRARGAYVIAVATEGNEDVQRSRRRGALRAAHALAACSRCWRSFRCSCWPTTSPASAGSTSTSRATSPRPSRSSSRRPAVAVRLGFSRIAAPLDPIVWRR